MPIKRYINSSKRRLKSGQKSAIRWLQAQECVFKEKREGMTVTKMWEPAYLNAELGTHSEAKLFLCQLGYVTLNMVINNI